MGLLIEHLDLIGVSIDRGSQPVDGSYRLFSRGNSADQGISQEGQHLLNQCK